VASSFSGCPAWVASPTGVPAHINRLISFVNEMPAVATALPQSSNCNDDGEIRARYCDAACTTPSVAPASSSSSGAQSRQLKLAYGPTELN